MSTIDQKFNACDSHPNHGLTSDESRLIADFRLAKASAQQMLLALAAQYSCTLPTESVRRPLVG